MRNELHFRLNWLHRLVQSSHFCLRGDQKYLILTEREGQRKAVKSSFTDEGRLVAHPVGYSTPGNSLHGWMPCFRAFPCQLRCSPSRGHATFLRAPLMRERQKLLDFQSK